MLVSICYKTINNSVSIFHSQFALDMFFFFKQFQSHCFYKAFSYTSFFFSCPGDSFPRGNYVDNKSSEKQFSLGEISRGILSGGNYLWGNFPGAIIRGAIIQGAISGEQFSRRQLSEGQLSGRQFSSGAIVWTSLFQYFCYFCILSKWQKLCHFLRKNVILY